MALSKFLDPKNDVAFRKVFGSEQHKDIVIHFINDILELKGKDQIENTFSHPLVLHPPKTAQDHPPSH